MILQRFYKKLSIEAFFLALKLIMINKIFGTNSYLHTMWSFKYLPQTPRHTLLKILETAIWIFNKISSYLLEIKTLKERFIKINTLLENRTTISAQENLKKTSLATQNSSFSNTNTNALSNSIKIPLKAKNNKLSSYFSLEEKDEVWKIFRSVFIVLENRPTSWKIALKRIRDTWAAADKEDQELFLFNCQKKAPRFLSYFENRLKPSSEKKSLPEVSIKLKKETVYKNQQASLHLKQILKTYFSKKLSVAMDSLMPNKIAKLVFLQEKNTYYVTLTLPSKMQTTRITHPLSILHLRPMGIDIGVIFTYNKQITFTWDKEKGNINFQGNPILMTLSLQYQDIKDNSLIDTKFSAFKISIIKAMKNLLYPILLWKNDLEEYFYIKEINHYSSDIGEIKFSRLMEKPSNKWKGAQAINTILSLLSYIPKAPTPTPEELNKINNPILPLSSFHKMTKKLTYTPIALHLLS